MTIDKLTGELVVSRGGQIGTLNHNGMPAFTCQPPKGRIGAGDTQKIIIALYPEAESEDYHDRLTVTFAKGFSHDLEVSGRAWGTSVFVAGTDRQCVSRNEDVLSLQLPLDGKLVQTSEGCLILPYSIKKNGPAGCVVRTICLGLIKAEDPKKKGVGEVIVEPITGSDVSSWFSVNSQKVSLEAGACKPLEVTFSPQGSVAIGRVAEAELCLSIKADVSTRYKLILRARVVE